MSTETNSRTSFGIMQGRLVPPEGGRYQSIPRERWRDEFPRAQAAGIGYIEWIVDASLPSARSVPHAARSVTEPGPDDDDGAEELTVIVDSVAEHLINEMFPGAEEVS